LILPAFEVFSTTSYPEPAEKPFNVKTVAQTIDLIQAWNWLKVKPDYCFDDGPHFDILIVPGGYGAEEIEIHNETVINWLRIQMANVEVMASVCTGAFILAKAGLLNGKWVTTHWMDIDRLEREFPNVTVQRNVKFIDECSIITSGGIFAIFMLGLIPSPNNQRQYKKMLYWIYDYQNGLQSRPSFKGPAFHIY